MNPLELIAQMAAQGQGGAQQPEMGAGDALSQQVSALRASNPELILQHLRQMRQLTAALIPHTAETIPVVARALASNLKGLEAAIEGATKALTAQTVAQGPISMSAVSGGMSSGGDF